VITVVPGRLALITPVTASILAMTGADEFHVPPAGVAISVAVVPVHMADGPTIGEGSGFTVTSMPAWQPAALVTTTDVVPLAAIPELTSTVGDAVVGDTVATVVTLLVHVPPPPMPLLSVVLDPPHMVVLPDIGPGSAFTVMLLVPIQPDDVI
jgi:hypothetical protein